MILKVSSALKAQLVRYVLRKISAKTFGSYTRFNCSDDVAPERPDPKYLPEGWTVHYLRCRGHSFIPYVGCVCSELGGYLGYCLCFRPTSLQAATVKPRTLKEERPTVHFVNECFPNLFRREFTASLFFFPVKFLEVIKPFCAVLPEIQKPERRVSIIYSFYFSFFQYACSFSQSWSSDTWCNWRFVIDSVQREGVMDSHHPVHLPGVLPGSFAFRWFWLWFFWLWFLFTLTFNANHGFRVLQMYSFSLSLLNSIVDYVKFTTYYFFPSSDSLIRNHVIGLRRSFLLDESHSRFKQRCTHITAPPPQEKPFSNYQTTSDVNQDG